MQPLSYYSSVSARFNDRVVAGQSGGLVFQPGQSELRKAQIGPRDSDPGFRKPIVGTWVSESHEFSDSVDDLPGEDRAPQAKHGSAVVAFDALPHRVDSDEPGWESRRERDEGVHEALARCQSELRAQEQEFTARQSELLAHCEAAFGDFTARQSELLAHCEATSLRAAEADQKSAKLESELDVQRSRHLQDRLELLSMRTLLTSEAGHADAAQKERRASAEVMEAKDWQISKLSSQIGKLEAERRDAEMHAYAAQETCAHLEQSSQFHQVMLRHENSEARDREEALEAQLDCAQEQLGSMQCQWIEAESQQYNAQATFRAVHAEMAELHERSTCCVCFDNPRCVVLQPCWHHVLCGNCVQALAHCPICRMPIVAYNHIICS